MTVEFSDDKDDPLGSDWLTSLGEIVLKGEGLDYGAVVSINLVGPDAIAALNERHLGRAGPTDVLAFPIEDFVPGEVPATTAGGPPLLVGDVVICPVVVRRQAAESAVAFDDEMALMVVHGILHLLGYDHEVAADAERMEQRERELLGAAGRSRP